MSDRSATTNTDFCLLKSQIILILTETEEITQQVAKYKKYIYKAEDTLRVGVINTESMQKLVEKQVNFVKWVDTDWQEIRI